MDDETKIDALPDTPDIGALANALADAQRHRQQAIAYLRSAEDTVKVTMEAEKAALAAFNAGVAAMRPKRPRKPKAEASASAPVEPTKAARKL